MMKTDFYNFWNEYSVEYRYHTEGRRQIVEEIVAYFLEPKTLGEQVTAKELDEKGFIVKDEMDLQALLDYELAEG